jgi:hypothetical protein
VPSSNTYQDRKYYPGETFAYNGVDRVDNTRGYFDDNVTVACGRCNRSRSSLSVTEWESYLERIVRFRRTYPNSAYTEAPAMSDTAQVKTIIEATLTGLNTPRRIARWYDVSIALARAEEAKIAEAFRGVFGRMTLAELATAREVVDGAVAYDLAQSTVTAPPAPSIAPPSVTSTKGKKR